MTTVTVTHNAGFFSCCSIRLHDIIMFFNTNKRLPDIVDSSTQFIWYKRYPRDITFDYFNNYSNYDTIQYIKDIDYNQDYQLFYIHVMYH